MDTEKKRPVYDAAFRQLFTSALPDVIIPVNEMYHTGYGMKSSVQPLNTVFVTKSEDGRKHVERSADAVFTVNHENRMYHMECQSRNDPKIMKRMPEYGNLSLRGGKTVTRYITMLDHNTAVNHPV
ncbi:MAG: hypothetical protein VZT48_05435 [Bulleidia sp.]|nr:hypothetical protein [Bulleidia sp.]